MTGSSTSQSDAPLTLALDARWLDASRVRDVGFRIALVVAVASHLFFGAGLTGRLHWLLRGVFGPRRGARREIGDAKGEIDGVAAEVIDAAEFNKRFISFKTGNADAEADARPQPPAEKSQPHPEAKPEEKVEPRPEPETKPAAALDPADGWEAAEPTPRKQEDKTAKKPVEDTAEKPETQDKPHDPRKETARTESPVLSEAEMRDLVTQSVEDLQSALVTVSTPGAARLGEASPYVRGVIRTLKNSMPRPRGMKGKVVIQLAIGANGDIEAIRVVRSSGRPALDRIVVEGVYRTKLIPPPATASPRERIFQIGYEYN